MKIVFSKSTDFQKLAFNGYIQEVIANENFGVRK
jgi:hypothetical protein